MCYPSLHIPLHQPNPREPPCAPSAYPTPGYSGDPLAAQRSTRPTQPSATPTRVRPRFRRAKSLLRVAICLDSHHLPPGPSCTDSYVLSPCWVPSSVVRILHGLSHAIPHGPAGSGTGIIIAILQKNKLTEAEPCCCRPFQEQEEEKPEL